MLRRTMSACFGLGLGLFLTAAAAQTSPTLDRIRTSGVLRVGLTGDYKPFSFKLPDGRYEGADVEMAESLAKAIGVRLQFVPTEWAVILPDFVEGRFDIAMGGVTVTAPRAERGLFSTVIITDGKRPIARCEDKARFTSVAAIDQPGVRVVVNPGAANEAFAKANFKRATVTVHPDNATVFDQIVNRRADVMVTDGVEVDLQAQIRPSLCATQVPQAFTSLEKAYLLPKDPALKTFVDNWFKGEMTSGRWAQALQRAQH